MEKIEKVEDLVSLRKITQQDMVMGHYILLMKEGISEYYGEYEINRCKDVNAFCEELVKSLKSNYLTLECHDLYKLRVGFMSLRNDGNIHFSVRIGTLKRYLNKAES